MKREGEKWKPRKGGRNKGAREIAGDVCTESVATCGVATDSPTAAANESIYECGKWLGDEGSPPVARPNKKTHQEVLRLRDTFFNKLM